MAAVAIIVLFVIALRMVSSLRRGAAKENGKKRHSLKHFSAGGQSQARSSAGRADFSTHAR
jgi:hypothetical protein